MVRMETTMLYLLVLVASVTQMMAEQETGPSNLCNVPGHISRSTLCTSCAASARAVCPSGFRKVTSGAGNANCSYAVTIGGRLMELPGCHHTCEKSITERSCCPDFWGPLCLPCPRWKSKTCNRHGSCMSGGSGNGTCVCEEGFTGYACQDCTMKHGEETYGEDCKSACQCVHGECNGGADGNGECYCQPPYSGPTCEQVSAACKNCSSYSYCKGAGDTAVCECLPGFKKMAHGCEGVCSPSHCDENAECSYLGGRTFQCRCKVGFVGDGKLCLPLNPCSKDNGGCPANSTICVFTFPGKSVCRCMNGMEGSPPSAGCTLKSACADDTCDRTAHCETLLDGHPRCLCEHDEIGDGKRCYSNLMERVMELDRAGSQKGKLYGTITLFVKGCQLTLAQHGPFTAFVPLLKEPLTGIDEAFVCKNHLILGQHLYKDLEGKDFNTYGGLQARTKTNKQFILLDAPDKLYTVIQEDIPASNGVIHIIDTPITKTLPNSPRDEQYATKTIDEILRMDEKYNRFLSLVDNCGARMPLKGPGPLTVFIPTNQAVDNFRDGNVIYMLTDAKHKLQELLKHHMFSMAALTVDQLAFMPQIQTMANQVIKVNITSDGKILLGDKGATLETTNIIGSNGIIHTVNGVLVPPSIVPILPHRCDVNSSKITVAPCVRCSYLYETQCPDGSTELESHMTGCDYNQINPLTGLTSLNKGCAKYCNTTQMRAECCKGFYGPDCKPCIGGFTNPCYGKGTCFDGIHGNGSCGCKPGFTGMACHICSDPNKHGENCDEDCRCLHGVCDNRPGSLGACRVGRGCNEGYSGDYCDRAATPCNADGLSEHCHIHAYCIDEGTHTTCVCTTGYEGDGLYCTAVNLCLKPERGGCNTNAQCVYAGPGNMSCVCNEGWTGSGTFCSEIDNCLLPARGGCHANADCTALGPGQSQCTCHKGFMGDGIACDMINPCKINNGGCHALATCSSESIGNRSCECPEGYGGDGLLCYGTILENVEMHSDLSLFYLYYLSDDKIDLSGNITAFLPSSTVLRQFPDRRYWIESYRRPFFVRAHFLQGVYSIEDLDLQVNKKLPTLNPGMEWEITNITGKIQIGNATIVGRNLPALNGYLHIIDQVLVPSDIPPPPPSIMEFLNNTPTLSLFRQAALLFNLTRMIRTHKEYTFLIPHDDAVKVYLNKSNSTQLDEEVFKNHIITDDHVFLDHIHDGTTMTTLLGTSYQLMFHVNSENKTLANGVPLDGRLNKTSHGVVAVIPQVLPVNKNRCGKDIITNTRGRCSPCDGKPRCYSSKQSTPFKNEFPPNMRSNCKYRKKVGTRYKSVQGCVISCTQVTQDQSCCPGHFGHNCYKCPGELNNWCSNNGQCNDSNFGNGECKCNEGFHGTACEDCEPGRYGKDCKSACSCVHGKCLDGMEGDGRCLCYKDWKGVNCSTEIVADACGGVCDENANCVTDVGANPTCICTAGYEGNGTSCKVLHLCASANGGCSPAANCTETIPGERTCTCREGYTGDGVVCLEIDGCLIDNGGCSRIAECIKTGPNVVACRCSLGYTGDGHFCFPFNPCRVDNGGCGEFARCRYSGHGGERNCSCMGGYVGDGFVCRGSTRLELFRRPDTFFHGALILNPFRSRALYGEGPFTVFAPLTESIGNYSADPWTETGRNLDLIKYHIVSCEKLLLDNLKSTSTAMALSGHLLTFTAKEGTVYINGDTKIVTSDYTTYDGVIHFIDKVLIPYELKDKPQLSTQMNYTQAAEVYGYTKFRKLIEDADLLGLLQESIHQPFTMFWPSDKALSSLPAARQAWLSSPDHRDQLVSLIKAHIIRNLKATSVCQPGKNTVFRTMHGSKISFTCDPKLVGNVMLNDNSAQIIERFMAFNVGLAYGIDQLLEPPGLGAHCDDLVNRTTYSTCGECFLTSFSSRCPFGSIDTGKTERCIFEWPRHRMLGYGFQSRRSYFNHRDFSFSLRSPVGCKKVCLTQAWSSLCCKNHFGRDCQVCEGGVEAPCGDHGDCDDGIRGTGKCNCHLGFRGVACEMCEPGRYGPNCTACPCMRMFGVMNGMCDDGIEGDGSCTCSEGWSGDRCQLKLEKKPVCDPVCHPNAVCLPDNMCQCEGLYVGNGTICTAPDLCAEYNGGCHQHGDCSQTGVSVNCSCQSGYSGDGFSCSPINRCVEEPNGGCSDFATCQSTGPNERSCECLPGYVGKGIQCLEQVIPPVDRCLQDNGGCDPKATCRDLHFHGSTAGVFHLRSPAGKYKMNYTEAEAACQAEEASLATFAQMSDAQQLGMHMCVAGWIDGKKVGYPTRFPSVKCGDNHVGIVLYKDPVEPSSKYDAYCHRMQDVSCVCISGYVGNGDFCNGDLVSVLASDRNSSMFYNMLLTYSKSSAEGQNLLDFLTSTSSYATLFVPHNSGFSINETLTGRDMEYHTSTNNTNYFYEDLKQYGIVTSRLGYNISVVVSTVNVTGAQNSQTVNKLVNKRMVLLWDIPASNGIIHIIEGPLRAPPPVHHPSVFHPRSGGATATTILVTILIVCTIAGLGYYVFKHKNNAFRFQYFKNEDETASAGGGKPALVNIPNPLYSGYRAFTEPFGDSGPEAAASEGTPPILEQQ